MNFATVQIDQDNTFEWDVEIDGFKLGENFITYIRYSRVKSFREKVSNQIIAKSEFHSFNEFRIKCEFRIIIASPSLDTQPFSDLHFSYSIGS